MKDSDGNSPQTLTELIMETGPSLESGTEEKTSPRRNHLGDYLCQTGALILGDKPHFLFCSAIGWGRYYLTDTQIAAFVEDGSTYIANIVRSKQP